MSRDIKNSNDRQGPPALETGERARKRESALSLEMEPIGTGTGTALRSSDPYNTSGSFDRTKNWSKVGKR